jgi:hypothetical protein
LLDSPNLILSIVYTAMVGCLAIARSSNLYTKTRWHLEEYGAIQFAVTKFLAKGSQVP